MMSWDLICCKVIPSKAETASTLCSIYKFCLSQRSDCGSVLCNTTEPQSSFEFKFCRVEIRKPLVGTEKPKVGQMKGWKLTDEGVYSSMWSVAIMAPRRDTCCQTWTKSSGFRWPSWNLWTIILQHQFKTRALFTTYKPNTTHSVIIYQNALR
jgi:hypothetical protein